MKTLLKALSFVVVSVSAGFACAGSHPVDSCDRIEVTWKSNECWKQKYQPWERTLRKTLVLAEKRIAKDEMSDAVQESRVQYLHDAQTAWEAYVSVQCGNVIEFEHGGTGAPSAMYQCRISKTKARVGELKATYGFSKPQ
jgi:uncharacterized protein YecT (DUF1311 family)